MNTLRDFTDPVTEEQREQFRAQQSHQMHAWVEQRVWDLCDDIGKGYNQLDKLSDGEVMHYARGVMNTLESILERFECKELRIRTLVDGALGERHHRKYGEGGHYRASYRRRLFANLAVEIRRRRVAMLDHYETFNYPEWEGWRKRVWAIERKGVEREEWQEFERLQHELNALYSLQSWLSCSEHWREKNWAWRNSQEVKVAA